MLLIVLVLGIIVEPLLIWQEKKTRTKEAAKALLVTLIEQKVAQTKEQQATRTGTTESNGE